MDGRPGKRDTPRSLSPGLADAARMVIPRRRSISRPQYPLQLRPSAFAMKIAIWRRVTGLSGQ